MNEYTKMTLMYLKEKHQFIIDNIDGYYLYNGRNDLIGLYKKNDNNLEQCILTFLLNDFINWLRLKKIEKIKFKICGVITEENLKL